ncbi:MAG TPA: class I SAM-dependent methyltransferase [Acidimicrobiales bacterium]
MTTVQEPTALDPDKLMSFVFRAVGEVGATLNTALVVMGDKLGLYRAMAGAGPLTPAELAERTSTSERYVREWLNAQAAGEFVTYDPESGRYTLPPEQTVALTDDSSPAFLPGFFQIALGSVIDSPRITEVARTGAGIGWGDHVHDVHDGCERFFRPGYNAHLVDEWLPALDGIVPKLEYGASVADVGCGHGASTILMAESFPRSRFIGFDYHEGSIATARMRADEAGVSGRVKFDATSATSYRGNGYDLVTMFDCLHDMGDPVGAARHVLEALAPDGTWMIVEPAAGDRVEDNLNPVGRAYYSFSTLLCTPSSLAQDVGLALGAQAGEARIRDVVTTAGFRSFRRVAETPFNIVYEARP